MWMVPTSPYPDPLFGTPLFFLGKKSYFTSMDLVVQTSWDRIKAQRAALKKKQRELGKISYVKNLAPARAVKRVRKQKVAIKHGREAIAMFVESNVQRMQQWLDDIAANEGPLVAFKCMTEVIEYHIPKLARTEHTGADEGPVEIMFSWRPPEN